jgi:hypothetical protein
MKKNVLSLAVATSVAALTMASAQAAMYTSPNGTGEVLLFPFYDAENGNSTNMHIVNTTSKVMAVKVRFLEYKASYEVLDFNLYLSPKDHFAFGVIMDPNGTGGAIITSDNSCTVPALGTANGAFTGTTVTGADGTTVRTQPFVNYEFLKSTVGGVPTPFVDSDIARTLRGHVEIIQMGVVSNIGTLSNPAKATELAVQHADMATHGADGVPASCAGLDAAFSKGAWATDVTAGITQPINGLYGLAYHINVEDAAAWGFEPTAIADWSNAAKGVHAIPGSLAPSLGSGEKSSIISNNGQSTDVTWATGIDAVSSLFMTPTIINDVQLNSAIGGQTDWVTTFPTKRAYVTNGYGPADPVVAPFTKAYTGVTTNADKTGYIEIQACEPVTVKSWDREEQTAGGSGNSFSPLPPGAAGNKICDEQHVAAWGTGAASALNVERGLSSIGFPYTEGWSRWTFGNGKDLCGNETTGAADYCMKGLPATGFAAYKYANGTSGAVMMNYGHAAEHKTVTSVSGS